MVKARHVLLFAGAILLIFLSASVALGGAVTRVSTDSAGGQANGNSYKPSVSADGDFVAFESLAFNLVPGDINGVSDIFVKSVSTGVLYRVSTDSAGGQSNGKSFGPCLSSNGLFVVFESQATNLVPGDTNGKTDIFVKDTMSGQTTRISTGSAGAQADGSSSEAAISSSGRYVAFYSLATNLVPGDTNGVGDVFLKDLVTGQTTRVSTDSAGAQANGISRYASVSDDGRLVAFYSRATNLVPGDTAGYPDIFVKNLATGETTRVSTGSEGEQGNYSSELASISADGRYVAFKSWASNLVDGDTNRFPDIFVKDTATGQTMRVSTDSSGGQANGESYNPSISADGGFIAFYSSASNLITGDSNGTLDVFVKNMDNGETVRVSEDSGGTEGNQRSERDYISADGRFVAFESLASNLVPGDTNGMFDIFLTDAAASCSSGKPVLSLSRRTAYWGSYADYQSGLLSVDYRIANAPGGNPAFVVMVTGSTADNGVTPTFSSPLLLGNIIGGASSDFTLEYDVPAGVTGFKARVYAAGQDGCGTGYTYP